MVTPDANSSPIPARSRGSIALDEASCTSCMVCARECPDWCIHIEAHQEIEPAVGPGGRTRQTDVLDRFAIDYSLCLYCGICIEVCPFDALFWSPEITAAEPRLVELIHERGRLAQPLATVPVPLALDPGAVVPDAPRRRVGGAHLPRTS